MCIDTTAAVTIKGGTYTSTSGDDDVLVIKKAKSVEINGGDYSKRLTVSADVPITINGGVYEGTLRIDKSKEIIIKGGKFNAGFSGIYLVEENSHIIIENGEFYGTQGVQMCNSTAIINGGTFETWAVIWCDGDCYVEVNGGKMSPTTHFFVGDNGTTEFKITNGEIELPKDFTNSNIDESSSITGGEIVIEDEEAYDTLVDYIPEDKAPENTGTPGKVTIVDAKVKNDTTGKEYTTFQDAIDAASAGDTITALTNKKEIKNGVITVAEGKDITIDLNGKTLTGNFSIEENATVEFKNGNIQSKIEESVIESKGNVTVTDVNITAVKHPFRIKGGSLVVNSGTFKTLGFNTPSTTYAMFADGASDVIINGGTFIGPKENKNGGRTIMHSGDGGKLTINGGVFYGHAEAYGWEININGGATAEINGGSFGTDIDADDEKKYLNTSKAVSFDGTYYTVVDAKAEIENGRRYASVQDAIAAADDSDSVIAYDDVTITEGNDKASSFKVTKNKRVVFDLNNGVFSAAMSVEDGSIIVIESGKYSSETAKNFVPVGKIIYNDGGTYTVVDKTFEPAAPENCYFEGWYTSSTFDEGTKVEFNNLTNNVIYYPKFTATEYTITYNLDGGTVALENPVTYTALSNDIKLNNPTKKGYTFAGWTGTDLNAASDDVTIAAGSTGNREYTATWTAAEYSISYELNDGTAGENAPSKHIYGTATTLVSPTKEGCIFAGWYTDDEFTNIVTSLAADGYEADITLYAKWVEENAERTINMYVNDVNANNAEGLTGVEVKAGDIVTVDVKIEDLTVAHAIWSITYDTEKFELVSTLTGQGEVVNGVISDSVDFQEGKGYAPGAVLKSYKFKALPLDYIDEDGVEAEFVISNTSAGTTFEDYDGQHKDAENNGALKVLFPAEKREVIIRVDDTVATEASMTIPYDGEPHNVTVVTDPVSDVKVTIEKDGKILTEDELDLIDSGDYVVTYEVPKGNGYGYEIGEFVLTIGAPEYKVEVNTGKYYRADYVLGKKLVLVYTNAKGAYFTYDGKLMLDVTKRGYKFDNVEEYENVYAYVADGVTAAAGILADDKHSSVKPVFGDSNKPVAVEYTNNMNGVDNVDIKDITSIFATYNVGDIFTKDDYMIQILKADTDGNKYINGVDTNSVVSEAYSK